MSMRAIVRAAFAALLTLAALACTAQAADAAVSKAFDGALDCTVRGDGTRLCAGTVPTFDGTPLDVNLVLPPAPGSGPDGDFPLIMEFHGWGGSKLSSSGSWTDDGYAYFSISDRGWGSSCGGTDPKRLQAVCAKGYNHLLDTRYEVRDVQELVGRLVDDGLVDPQRIGAFGSSYGGGMSMALAALRNRVMMPDGSLVPWKSPDGTADRARRRGARHPVERSRLLADAERSHPRLRCRRALRRRPDRDREAELRHRALRHRACGEQLRATRDRSRRGSDQLVLADQRRRALRLEPARATDRRRNHRAPFELLHR